MTGKDRKIDIMGIVNVTDNSYFAESRCLDESGDTDVRKVAERAARMKAEGATIIDIGACSTRPGSDPVGEDEEWRRLEPAVRAIMAAMPDTVLSVDTYFASVAAKTAELMEKKLGMSRTKVENQFIVNDITAGRDPQMLDVAAKTGARFVAMHMRGNPKTMQSLCDYRDVTEDVCEYFWEFDGRARNAGVKEWILDPGFGFAKDIDQNYKLLKELGKFGDFGKRVLVGVSRKSMIYKLFGITPEESLPATQVLHYKALENGADILRVHDVAEAVRTVGLYRYFC
ncbi:MAG: dihydropteroate synthase [Candidatus Cryptobacteroides sp.]